MPALVCQCEGGYEKDAEYDCLSQLVPTEFPYSEWRGLLDEIGPSAKKQRRKSDGHYSRQQAEETGECQRPGHDALSEGEGPSMGKLGAKALDPGAMDSQLHVMDLVAGEDQVSNPKHPRGGPKFSRHHVVGRRSRSSQSDRPDNFREHAKLVRELFAPVAPGFARGGQPRRLFAP
jgi:hypothetical protein